MKRKVASAVEGFSESMKNAPMSADEVNVMVDRSWGMLNKMAKKWSFNLDEVADKIEVLGKNVKAISKTLGSKEFQEKAQNVI